ncbi:hypothetical protein ABK040_014241 [Willaertia magna]
MQKSDLYLSSLGKQVLATVDGKSNNNKDNINNENTQDNNNKQNDNNNKNINKERRASVVDKLETHHFNFLVPSFKNKKYVLIGAKTFNKLFKPSSNSKEGEEGDKLNEELKKEKKESILKKKRENSEAVTIRFTDWVKSIDTKMSKSSKRLLKKKTSIPASSSASGEEHEEEDLISPRESIISETSDTSISTMTTSNLDKIVTMNLSDFLEEFDSKDDLLYNVSSLELKDAFKLCLQCIYMPINTQFTNQPCLMFLHPCSDKSETNNNEENLLIALKETLQQSFPQITNNEMNEMWKNFEILAFPSKSNHPVIQMNTPTDIIKKTLYYRKYLIDKDAHPFYTKRSFAKDEDYQLWRNTELEGINNALHEVDELRKHPFHCKLNICVADIEVNSEKTFAKKKATPQIFYKIRGSKEYNEYKPTPKDNRIIIVSKTIPTVHNNGMVEGNFSQEEHLFELFVEEQDLLIDFYYLNYGGFSKPKFGNLTLPLQTLFKEQFKEGCWGKQSITKEFSLDKLDDKEHILGKVKVNFYLQFQKYPIEWSKNSNNSSNNYSFEKERITNYQNLYLIAVKSIVPIRNKLKDCQCEEFLTPTQAWILNEFENQFGITEIYKRLSYLEILSERVNMIIPFHDELLKCLDLIHTNIQNKFFTMSTTERNRYFDITEKLLNKIETILLQFRTTFVRNQPKGAVKSLLDVHELLTTKYNRELKFENYKKYMEQFLLKALQNHYNSLKQNIMEALDYKVMDGSVLVELCDQLRDVIDDIFDFSGLFVLDNYEYFSLTFYYNSFYKDILQMKQSNKIQGFHMLALCHKIKLLHEEIHLDFDEKELQSFPFIDTKELSKGYEEKYMEELHTLLSKWINQSISLDTFEPITASVFYSTSVVDFFTSANQTFEMIKNLEFKNSKLLERYATLVIQATTLEYAKKLYDLCAEDLKSQVQSPEKPKSLLVKLSDEFIPKYFKNDNSNNNNNNNLNVGITKQFVVRLNDIEASRQELKSICHTIFDNSTWLEYEENEENGEQLLDDDSKSNLDEIDFEAIESKINQKNRRTVKIVEKKENESVKQFTKVFNELLNDLILMLVNILNNAINTTVTKVMDLAKVELNNPNLEKSDVISQFQSKSDQIIQSTLFDKVFTPILEILSENCYKDLLKRILQQLFITFVNELSNILFDPNIFTKKSSERQFLTKQQVYVLESILDLAIIYFCGNSDDDDSNNHSKENSLQNTPNIEDNDEDSDEDENSDDEEEEEEGLSREFAKKKSKVLRKLIKLYNTPTSTLIKLLQKFKQHPKLEQSYPIKSYHLIIILYSRKRIDENAHKIVKEYKSTVESQRLQFKFNIYEKYNVIENLNKNLNIIYRVPCLEGTKIAPGTLYLTNCYLLFEFKLSNTEYHKIYLKDITKLILMDGNIIGTRGITICFKNNDNNGNTKIFNGSASFELQQKDHVKFYFKDETQRDVLLQDLRYELENNLQQKVEIINPNKLTDNKSILNNGGNKGFNIKNLFKSSTILDEETKYDEIRKKFNINPNIKFISDFSCMIQMINSIASGKKRKSSGGILSALPTLSTLQQSLQQLSQQQPQQQAGTGNGNGTSGETYRASIYLFEDCFCIYTIEGNLSEKIPFNLIDELMLTNQGDILLESKVYNQILIKTKIVEEKERFEQVYNDWKERNEKDDNNNKFISPENLSKFSQKQLEEYYHNRFNNSNEVLLSYFISKPVDGHKDVLEGICFIGEENVQFENSKDHSTLIIPYSLVKKVMKNKISHGIGVLEIETINRKNYKLSIGTTQDIPNINTIGKLIEARIKKSKLLFSFSGIAQALHLK